MIPSSAAPFTTATCGVGQEASTSAILQCSPGDNIKGGESCSCGASSVFVTSLNSYHDTHPGQIQDVIFGGEQGKSCCQLCGQYRGQPLAPSTSQFNGKFIQGVATNWCGDSQPLAHHEPLVPSAYNPLESDPNNYGMVCVCVASNGPFCPHCIDVTTPAPATPRPGGSITAGAACPSCSAIACESDLPTRPYYRPPPTHADSASTE